MKISFIDGIYKSDEMISFTTDGILPLKQIGRNGSKVHGTRKHFLHVFQSNDALGRRMIGTPKKYILKKRTNILFLLYLSIGKMMAKRKSLSGVKL